MPRSSKRRGPSSASSRPCGPDWKKPGRDEDPGRERDPLPSAAAQHRGAAQVPLVWGRSCRHSRGSSAPGAPSPAEVSRARPGGPLAPPDLVPIDLEDWGIVLPDHPIGAGMVLVKVGSALLPTLGLVHALAFPGVVFALPLGNLVHIAAKDRLGLIGDPVQLFLRQHLAGDEVEGGAPGVQAGLARERAIALGLSLEDADPVGQVLALPDHMVIFFFRERGL